MEMHDRGKRSKVLIYPLLAVVLLAMLLSFSVVGRAISQDDQQLPAGTQAQGSAGSDAEERAFGKAVATRQVIDNFQTSLEMKEKVDFLLTPAFLVQESISDDAVLKYPEE